MDGISVQSHVIQVHAQTTDALLTQRTLITGPLKSSNHGVSDLSKVGNTHSTLSVDVGTDEIVAEAPNLLGGGGDIGEAGTKVGVFTENLRTLLDIHSRAHLVF